MDAAAVNIPHGNIQRFRQNQILAKIIFDRGLNLERITLFEPQTLQLGRAERDRPTVSLHAPNRPRNGNPVDKKLHQSPVGVFGRAREPNSGSLRLFFGDLARFQKGLIQRHLDGARMSARALMEMAMPLALARPNDLRDHG